MKSRAHLVFPVLALALLAGPVQGAGNEPLPDGVSTAWVERVRSALESRAYGFTAGPGGAASALNGAQRFETRVATRGVEVAADRPAIRLELRAVGFGREGALAPLPEGRVETRGSRAELRRDGFDLVEWYENRPQGLEQGFDLATRPAGDPARRSVALELAASGGLRPVLRERDQQVAFLDASGTERLRYGGLVALDARGARVPSRLALAGDRVRIEVDDAGAVYPLVIDPLITTASWDPESNVANSNFGAAVSTAGDFNGDGYSDVIVGAPSEGLEVGRVYLFLGGPGGPDEIADASFAGIGARDRFGFAVAAAGNVNGDAFDDIVVGAPGLVVAGTSNEFGRIAVFLGNSGGLLQSPQVAQNCFGATNPQIRDGLGASVAGAGDVNMDGFDDVIAGGPELVLSTGSGVACIYPGSGSGINAGGVIRLGSSSGISGAVIASQSFGTAVSGAGDVNGDGFADVVIGASGSNGADNRSVGAAYVFHGPLVTGDAPEWAQLGDNRPFTVSGSSASFGGAVADAGDLNGDGFADIIVGAPNYDLSFYGLGNDTGAVFVFHGSASGIATPVTDCDPSNAFTNVPAQYCEFGTAGSARMGGVVATAGDLNGDGRADATFSELAANAQGGVGRAHVLYGDPSGAYAITLSFGPPAGGALASLATAGDPDRDGFSDLVIGVPEFSNGQTAEGRALLFRSTGDLPATAVAYSAEFNQENAAFSLGLSAGDINGDGFSDIVAGAPNYTGCGLIGFPDTNEGTIQVYYGGSCGPACGPFYFPGFCAYEGNEVGANFGWSVSASGDVNGDGYADVLVGVPGNSGGLFPFPADAGRAYLFLGGSSGLSATAATTIYGSETNAQLGLMVAIVGDVNGDGRADALIGEPYSDETSGLDAGSAHLHLGTASGIAATSAWDAIGSEANALFGSTLAGAGDVNRDGYADVIVGAPGTTAGAGAAYVYLGGPIGLAQAPVRTILGTLVNAELGGSVATAGDVNGDGYSDVAVGAPGEPSVAIYTGPALNLFDGAYGNPGSRFGSGLGTPGDVNGDGLSDLVVGAHWEDAGAGFAQGTAHLFLGSAAGIASVADRSWADCATSFCDFGVRSAGAADVNGDGFGDAVIGAFKYTNGQTFEGGFFVHFGNGGDGLERVPQQLTSAYAPIRPVGNTTSASFRTWAIGRSAAGRALVRIEVETKGLATPFDGLGTLLGGFQDSGLSGLMLEEAPQCSTSAPCKWRARVRARNPHFPGSPWLSPPENARTEADLRQAVDFDADGANDPADVCPTIANAGSDTDMDGVDNACDTCTNEVNAYFAGPVSKRIVVSGQLDDDADGRGNRCDFDYDNAGAVVTSGDFNQIKASVSKLLFNANCGAAPTNSQVCAEFDHDEAGTVITASDFNLSKAAVAKVLATQLPKCANCSPPFSRPLDDPLGPTLGKPICQAAAGVCPY